MTTPPPRRGHPHRRPTDARQVALATAIGVLLVALVAVGTVARIGSGDRAPTEPADDVAAEDAGTERVAPEQESGRASTEVTPWSPPDAAPGLEALDVPDAPAMGSGELRDLLADMTSGDGARLGARLAWDVDAGELDSAARALRPPRGTRLELLVPPVPTADGTRLLLVGLTGRSDAGRGTTVWEVGPDTDGSWRIVSIAP